MCSDNNMITMRSPNNINTDYMRPHAGDIYVNKYVVPIIQS